MGFVWPCPHFLVDFYLLGYVTPLSAVHVCGLLLFDEPMPALIDVCQSS
jgi:hypothetical protein